MAASDPSRWLDAAPEPLAVERADGLRHLPEIRAQAFLGLVRAGDELVAVLDRELRRQHDLGLRAFEVLLHLAVFAPDQRLRLTRLTEQVTLSQSRISRLVAELDARGLVTRSTVEEDSRGVLVTLTERGLETFVAAQETHLEGLDAHLFSRLSWEEVTQLATIAGKILGRWD